MRDIDRAAPNTIIRPNRTPMWRSLSVFVTASALLLPSCAAFEQLDDQEGNRGGVEQPVQAEDSGGSIVGELSSRLSDLNLPEIITREDDNQRDDILNRINSASANGNANRQAEQSQDSETAQGGSEVSVSSVDESQADESSVEVAQTEIENTEQEPPEEKDEEQAPPAEITLEPRVLGADFLSSLSPAERLSYFAANMPFVHRQGGDENAGIPWSGVNFKIAGCAPTSLANTLLALTGDQDMANPRVLAEMYNYGNGFATANGASYHNIAPELPNRGYEGKKLSELGVRVSGAKEPRGKSAIGSAAKEAFDNGGVIVFRGTGPPTTSGGGHFVMAVGYDPDNPHVVAIADSAEYTYSYFGHVVDPKKRFRLIDLTEVVGFKMWSVWIEE
jgi:hypothetical protein